MRNLTIIALCATLSGCGYFSPSKSSGYSVDYDKNYSLYSQQALRKDGQRLSRFNVEAAAGVEFYVGDDFTTPDDVAATSDTFANALSMSDAFERGERVEIAASYSVNPNRKLLLTGSYAKADGKDVTLGQIGGDDLTGTISDHERYSVEFGLRQYFKPFDLALLGSTRPYVDGKIGATDTRDIELTNARLGTAEFNGGTAGLYEGAWTLSGAAMVGVEFPVIEQATVGLETGIRYTDALDADTSVFNTAASLEGLNNGSETYTVPVMLRGRFRF